MRVFLAIFEWLAVILMTLSLVWLWASGDLTVITAAVGFAASGFGARYMALMQREG